MSRRSSIVSRILNSTAGAGALAALPYSLAATGDPNLTLAGMAATVVNASLIAHIRGRIETSREELSRRTEGLLDRLEDKGRLAEEVLESADFHALVFQAAVASAQESEAEKIDWYAAILAGAASTERPPELNARALLSSMTFLTAEEMRLARRFYEDADTEGWSVIDGLKQPMWGPNTGLFLRRLENADLISPRTITGGGPGGPTRSYFVTATFQRLMALVRESD